MLWHESRLFTLISIQSYMFRMVHLFTFYFVFELVPCAQSRLFGFWQLWRIHSGWGLLSRHYQSSPLYVYPVFCAVIPRFVNSFIFLYCGIAWEIQKLFSLYNFSCKHVMLILKNPQLDIGSCAGWLIQVVIANWHEEMSRSQYTNLTL